MSIIYLCIGAMSECGNCYGSIMSNTEDDNNMILACNECVWLVPQLSYDVR